MEHIIEILIMIIGITLIIGLITPSFSSNILGKIPDPIGSLLKNINSRKKVLLVYGGLFFLLAILLGPVDPFESGKRYYEEKKWSLAEKRLSEVPSENENYEEAQKLLLIARKNNFNEKAVEYLNDAKKKLEKNNWNEVIEILSDFPKDHRLFTEANKIITIANGRRNQQKFIDEWQRLKKIDDESGGKKHLKDNQSPVVKWYGEVGRNLSYNNNTILVRYEGIEFTLEPIWILEDDEINKIKSLKIGDKVYFSGRLNGETSITLWGMLDEPEMNVISSKLTNIDETTIYYDIPPEKQVVIRTKSDYKKAVIGKWSGNESTNLYDYGWSYSGIMLELNSDFTFTEYDLEGNWKSTKDWKQTHYWEKDSYGTWGIHHGNYSDTGKEYWAVEIDYSHVNLDWRFVIELTEFENAVKNIFYDLRLGYGYGENLFLRQGDILKKGKK